MEISFAKFNVNNYSYDLKAIVGASIGTPDCDFLIENVIITDVYFMSNLWTSDYKEISYIYTTDELSDFLAERVYDWEIVYYDIVDVFDEYIWSFDIGECPSLISAGALPYDIFDELEAFEI